MTSRDDPGDNRYRFSSDWIHQLESEDHWRLYWHQQQLLEGLVKPGDSVLEIGVGTGFTANYLRSKGLTVTTLDIDPAKRPDIVANVAIDEIPGRYDHITAFEVFEHIPYDDFLGTMPRLAMSTRRTFFMSVPIAEYRLVGVEIKLPRLRARSLSVRIPRRRVREQHHHWELGIPGFEQARIFGDLRDNGFSLTRSFTSSSRRYAAFAR